MSKFNVMFRCPCCNEPLDDYETSMYDIFQGMKEDCFNESMKAAYDTDDNDHVRNLSILHLDLGAD